jgi:hypothetical protein
MQLSQIVWLLTWQAMLVIIYLVCLEWKYMGIGLAVTFGLNLAEFYIFWEFKSDDQQVKTKEDQTQIEVKIW